MCLCVGVLSILCHFSENFVFHYSQFRVILFTRNVMREWARARARARKCLHKVWAEQIGHVSNWPEINLVKWERETCSISWYTRPLRRATAIHYIITLVSHKIIIISLSLHCFDARFVSEHKISIAYIAIFRAAIKLYKADNGRVREASAHTLGIESCALSG